MLDINQVIDAGKFGFWQCVSITQWYWWAIVITIAAIGIWWFIASYDDWLGPDFGSFIMTVVGIGLLFATFYAGKDTLVEKWKNDYAYPYIYSLPEEKYEVVYVKIDPEIKTDVRGGMFYIYSTSTMLTPLTVSFKGNGIETYTQWYDASMSLTDSERPYITFKRLTQDLGNDVKAGMYQPKVFLPESYKFTDIK